MEEKGLQVFKFDSVAKIRVVRIEDETWIVARDIARALDYREESLKSPQKLVQAVPDEWKGRKPIPTLGGEQSMTCLTEQGMYFFLARSDKPKALPFQKWIAGEVIPSIRKHGVYLTDDALVQALANPRRIGELLLTIANEREEKQALQIQVTALEEDKAEMKESIVGLKLRERQNHHKVKLAEALDVCKSTILTRTAAKFLNQSGVHGMGEKKLFADLRECRFYLSGGSDWNTPSQWATERGYAVLDIRPIETMPNRMRNTPRITAKGLAWIFKKYLPDCELGATDFEEMVKGGDSND